MPQPKYYTPFAVKIGVVCDSLLLDTFRSAANFIYISPHEDWQKRLEEIDLFLVVSTWRGCVEDDWRGVAQVNTPQRKLLYGMIERCKSLGKPVVFYSKEDPPNYEVFLEIAKRSDFVFTSAREMIPRYVEDCGHDRVDVLEFCIDPAYQNPIGCRRGPRKTGAVFSGSWMLKYPDRCQDLAVLFDAAISAGGGLCIHDRNSCRPEQVRYRFPAKYKPFVFPAVDHFELADVHKRFDWSVNINSVTTSETMFAARCYELLAEGCPVVSNYSLGVARKFPEIALSYTAKNTELIFGGAIRDSVISRQAAGIRAVMTGETCYDRVDRILHTVGIAGQLSERRVLVVIESCESDVCRMFEAQTYLGRTLCSVEELTADLVREYDYISFWDPARYYDPFYLEDMLNGFKWSAADFTTQSDNPYEVITGIPDLYSSILDTGFFDLEKFKENGGQSRIGNGIALPVRDDVFSPPHTISGKHVECRIVVEVSVGRQWRHFRYRTFDSLVRSGSFENIGIVLRDVDHGDPLTDAGVKSVFSAYPNVSEDPSVFPDGLPRIMLAAGDEILPAGFDEIVKSLNRGGVGIVNADVLMCGRSRRLLEDGLSVVADSAGDVVSLKVPVLVRHGNEDDSIGSLWMENRVKRPSLLRRAYICYNENGFWYTLRRIVFGNKSK